MQDKITAKIEFRFFEDQRNVLSNIGQIITFKYIKLTNLKYLIFFDRLYLNIMCILQNFFSIVIVTLYPVIIYIKF